MIDRAGRCGEKRRNGVGLGREGKGRADRLSPRSALVRQWVGNTRRFGFGSSGLGHLAPRIGEEHTGDDGVSRARVVDASRKGWEEGKEGGRGKGNWARIGRGRRGSNGGCRRAQGEHVPEGGELPQFDTYHFCVWAGYAHGTTAAQWMQRRIRPGPRGAQPLKLR